MFSYMLSNVFTCGENARDVLSVVSARAGGYLWTSNMHKLVIFKVLMYVFVCYIQMAGKCTGCS